MLIACMVAAGGFLGAAARYLISEWINERIHKTAISWGILAVNLSGSFLLGCVYPEKGMLGGEMSAFVFTGLISAFTTFSTFSAEAGSLLLRGEFTKAAISILLTVPGSILAFIAGYTIGGR